MRAPRAPLILWKQSSSAARTQACAAPRFPTSRVRHSAATGQGGEMDSGCSACERGRVGTDPRGKEEQLMEVTFATTAFAPVVLGFFGLGTGYLIWGPQELFGFPRRDASVDRATGIWGIWMPGFCQFVTGVYLFVALTWLESLKQPVLYTAALAFSAYGIHWFAMGWNRYQGNDNRPDGLMSIAFTIISVLGVVVFFAAGAWPVGILFSGLTGVYISKFFSSFRIGARTAPPPTLNREATSEVPSGTLGASRAPVTSLINPGERALGFFHIVTGLWLMYLTFATTLDISLKFALPGG
jgi:hypothetical protein